MTQFLKKPIIRDGIPNKNEGYEGEIRFGFRKGVLYQYVRLKNQWHSIQFGVTQAKATKDVKTLAGATATSIAQSSATYDSLTVTNLRVDGNFIGSDSTSISSATLAAHPDVASQAHPDYLKNIGAGTLEGSLNIAGRSSVGAYAAYTIKITEGASADPVFWASNPEFGTYGNRAGLWISEGSTDGPFHVGTSSGSDFKIHDTGVVTCQAITVIDAVNTTNGYKVDNTLSINGSGHYVGGGAISVDTINTGQGDNEVYSLITGADASNSTITYEAGSAQGTTAYKFKVTDGSIGDTQLAFPTGQDLSNTSVDAHFKRLRIFSSAAANELADGGLRLSGSITLEDGVTLNSIYNNNNVLTLDSLGGLVISDNITFSNKGTFTAGWAGEGFGISGNSDKYTLDIDNISVRGSMDVYELVINQIRASNGDLMVTDCGLVDVWTHHSLHRYYIDFQVPADDNTGTGAYHTFEEDDILLCQYYDLATDSNIVYYADVIDSTYTELNRIKINLYNADGTNAADNIVIPRGKVFARIGSTTEEDRMGGILLSGGDQRIRIWGDVDEVDDYRTALPIKAQLGAIGGLSAGGITVPADKYGLFSQDVYLHGTIQATSGYLGNETNGWSINANDISNGDLKLDALNQLIKVGSVSDFNRDGTAAGILIGKNSATSDFDFFAGKEDGNYIYYDGDSGAMTLKGSLIIPTTNEPPVTWRGDWASGTDYYVNDSVYYGTQSYINSAEHTSTNDTDVVTGTPSATSTSWSVMAAQGTAGGDGNDGDIYKQFTIYKNGATAPTVDDNGSVNGSGTMTPPTGWSLSPSDPGSDFTYISTSTWKQNNGAGAYSLEGSWSTVIQWTGDTGSTGGDGTDADVYKQFSVYSNATTAPATPSGGTVNSSGVMTSAPSGWANNQTSPPIPTSFSWVSNSTWKQTEGTGSFTIDTAWTAAAQVSGSQGATGGDGGDGHTYKVFYIYRNASDPSSAGTPSGGTVDSNGDMTSVPSNWSLTATTPTSSQFTYVSFSTWKQTNSTGAFAVDIDWTYATQFSGMDGIDAPKYVYAYKNILEANIGSEPLPQFGGSYVTPTLPVDWYAAPSSPSASYNTYLVQAIYQPGDVTAPTTQPTAITQFTGSDGTDGLAGGDGGDGDSIAVVNAYRRSSTTLSGSDHPTASSYNFSTHQLTVDNSWNDYVPVSDGNPCYVITATAIINGTAGTDSSLTWTEPTLLVQDGGDGLAGLPSSSFAIPEPADFISSGPNNNFDLPSSGSSIAFNDAAFYGFFDVDDHPIAKDASFASDDVVLNIDDDFNDSNSANWAKIGAIAFNTVDADVISSDFKNYIENTVVVGDIFVMHIDSNNWASYSVTHKWLLPSQDDDDDAVLKIQYLTSQGHMGPHSGLPFYTTIANAVGIFPTAYMGFSRAVSGADGADGTSVTILDNLYSLSELPASGSIGDAYIVGTDGNGHLFVWDGSQWNDAGNITGPTGDEGPQGNSGDTYKTFAIYRNQASTPYTPDSGTIDGDNNMIPPSTPAQWHNNPTDPPPPNYTFKTESTWRQVQSSGAWTEVSTWYTPVQHSGPLGNTGAEGPQGNSGADGADAPKTVWAYSVQTKNSIMNRGIGEYYSQDSSDNVQLMRQRTTLVGMRGYVFYSGGGLLAAGWSNPNPITVMKMRTPYFESDSARRNWTSVDDAGDLVEPVFPAPGSLLHFAVDGSEDTNYLTLSLDSVDEGQSNEIEIFWNVTEVEKSGTNTFDVYDTHMILKHPTFQGTFASPTVKSDGSHTDVDYNKWSLTLPDYEIASPTDVIWATNATYLPDNTIQQGNPITQFSGEIQPTYEVFSVYKNSELAPSTPTGGSVSNGVMTQPLGWSLSPIDPTPPNSIFISQSTWKTLDGGVTWTNNSGWSSPAKFSGVQGQDGADGVSGNTLLYNVNDWNGGITAFDGEHTPVFSIKVNKDINQMYLFVSGATPTHAEGDVYISASFENLSSCTFFNVTSYGIGQDTSLSTSGNSSTPITIDEPSTDNTLEWGPNGWNYKRTFVNENSSMDVVNISLDDTSFETLENQFFRVIVRYIRKDSHSGDGYTDRTIAFGDRVVAVNFDNSQPITAEFSPNDSENMDVLLMDNAPVGSSTAASNMLSFSATSPASPGLYMDGEKLGFTDGDTWKTYMDNTGKLELYGDPIEGAPGARFKWIPGNGVDEDTSLQIVADMQIGKIGSGTPTTHLAVTAGSAAVSNFRAIDIGVVSYQDSAFDNNINGTKAGLNIMVLEMACSHPEDIFSHTIRHNVTYDVADVTDGQSQREAIFQLLMGSINCEDGVGPILPNNIVIVTSHTSIKFTATDCDVNEDTQGIKSQLKDYGATSPHLPPDAMSDGSQQNSSYVLIGKKGIGVGNGFESIVNNLTTFVGGTEAFVQATIAPVGGGDFRLYGGFSSVGTHISGDIITTGKLKSNNYDDTALDTYYITQGTSIDLDAGVIASRNFSIAADGTARFRGDITASSGQFSGPITVGHSDNEVVIGDTSGLSSFRTGDYSGIFMDDFNLWERGDGTWAVGDDVYTETYFAVGDASSYLYYSNNMIDGEVRASMKMKADEIELTSGEIISDADSIISAVNVTNTGVQISGDHININGSTTFTNVSNWEDPWVQAWGINFIGAEGDEWNANTDYGIFNKIGAQGTWYDYSSTGIDNPVFVLDSEASGGSALRMGGDANVGATSNYYEWNTSGAYSVDVGFMNGAVRDTPEWKRQRPYIDPDSLYKISIRCKTYGVGDGGTAIYEHCLYFGLHLYDEFNADFNNWDASANEVDDSFLHPSWFGANAFPIGFEWQTVVFYVKGHQATCFEGLANDITAPAHVHASAKHMGIAMKFEDVGGGDNVDMLVDYVKIEREGGQSIIDGDTITTGQINASYVDVTSLLANDASITGVLTMGSSGRIKTNGKDSADDDTEGIYISPTELAVGTVTSGGAAGEGLLYTGNELYVNGTLNAGKLADVTPMIYDAHGELRPMTTVYANTFWALGGGNGAEDTGWFYIENVRAGAELHVFMRTDTRKEECGVIQCRFDIIPGNGNANDHLTAGRVLRCFANTVQSNTSAEYAHQYSTYDSTRITGVESDGGYEWSAWELHWQFSLKIGVDPQNPAGSTNRTAFTNFFNDTALMEPFEGRIRCKIDSWQYGDGAGTHPYGWPASPLQLDGDPWPEAGSDGTEYATPNWIDNAIMHIIINNEG